jgi:hypothetical protein
VFQQKAPLGLTRVQEPQPIIKKCCHLNIFIKKKLIKNGCNKKILPSASYAK